MCNCAFLAAVVMPVVVAPVRVVPVAVAAMASLPVLRGALVSVVMAAVVVVVTVSLAGRGAVRGLRKKCQELSCDRKKQDNEGFRQWVGQI